MSISPRNRRNIQNGSYDEEPEVKRYGYVHLCYRYSTEGITALLDMAQKTNPRLVQPIEEYLDTVDSEGEDGSEVLPAAIFSTFLNMYVKKYNLQYKEGRKIFIHPDEYLNNLFLGIDFGSSINLLDAGVGLFKKYAISRESECNEEARKKLMESIEPTRKMNRSQKLETKQKTNYTCNPITLEGVDHIIYMAKKIDQFYEYQFPSLVDAINKYLDIIETENKVIAIPTGFFGSILQLYVKINNLKYEKDGKVYFEPDDILVSSIPELDNLELLAKMGFDINKIPTEEVMGADPIWIFFKKSYKKPMITFVLAQSIFLKRYGVSLERYAKFPEKYGVRPEGGIKCNSEAVEDLKDFLASLKNMINDKFPDTISNQQNNQQNNELIFPRKR